MNDATFVFLRVNPCRVRRLRCNCDPKRALQSSRASGTVLDVRSFGSLSRAIIEIRGFLVGRMKYGPWMRYAVVTFLSQPFCSPSFSRRRRLEQFSSIIRCCNNILVLICVYYMLHVYHKQSNKYLTISTNNNNSCSFFSIFSCSQVK